jgi:hypothetical protein
MKRALGAFFLSLLILLSARSTIAHDAITTKVTFAREIRAILSARCASCHAAGGSAPMPLTTYEDVRPWARAIKEQVLTRRMPKWHAARGFGAFKNDPSLTPLEMALITSWVDGGLPFSSSSPRPGSASPSPVASASSSTRVASAPSKPVASAPSKPVASAFRRKIDIRKPGTPEVAIPAGAAEAGVQGRSRWVSAWSFEPGDPLITSATVTSDGGIVGTWVAGDGEIRMPAGTAIRVWGRVRVQLQRRAAADYEQPFAAKRSVLRFTTRAGPVRRVWSERIECGAPRTGRAAELLAVRPLLAAGDSARLWLERTGSTKTIVGWFRDFDPAFARTYWLARPADFGADARIASDGTCTVEVLLTSRR